MWPSPAAAVPPELVKSHVQVYIPPFTIRRAGPEAQTKAPLLPVQFALFRLPSAEAHPAGPAASESPLMLLLGANPKSTPVIWFADPGAELIVILRVADVAGLFKIYVDARPPGAGTPLLREN